MGLVEGRLMVPLLTSALPGDTREFCRSCAACAQQQSVTARCILAFCNRHLCALHFTMGDSIVLAAQLTLYTALCAFVTRWLCCEWLATFQSAKAQGFTDCKVLQILSQVAERLALMPTIKGFMHEDDS